MILSSLKRNAVEQTYDLLAHEFETELRLIDPNPDEEKRKPAINIWVNNKKDFVAYCEQYHGNYNVYAGINERTHHGKTKEEVVSVKTIVIDIDAVRTKGLASNDLELAEADRVADEIKANFKLQGFELSAKMMSGNGYQLWFTIPKIVLNEANRGKVEKKLQQLQKNIQKQYANESTVKIDNIGDLPRIIKVAGTLSIKGENSFDRPFRVAEWREWLGRKESQELRDTILLLNTEEPPIMLTIPVFENQDLNKFIARDEKLKRLLEGNTEGYPSRSEAEQALVTKLVHYKFPKEQVWQIMQKSLTEKWNEKNESYRELTYKKAVEFIGDKYYQEPTNNNDIDEELLPEKLAPEWEKILDEITVIEKFTADRTEQILYRFHFENQKLDIFSDELFLNPNQFACRYAVLKSIVLPPIKKLDWARLLTALLQSKLYKETMEKTISEKEEIREAIRKYVEESTIVYKPENSLGYSTILLSQTEQDKIFVLNENIKKLIDIKFSNATSQSLKKAAMVINDFMLEKVKIKRVGKKTYRYWVLKKEEFDLTNCEEKDEQEENKTEEVIRK